MRRRLTTVDQRVPAATKSLIGVFLTVLLLHLLLFAINSTAYFVGDDYDLLRRVGQQDSIFDVLDFQFAGGWSCLTYVSWYIDQQVWGGNPLGFHLTNLFWISILSVAIFALVREVLPETRLAPWCATLLFATHPLHDEAISYRSARAHTLGTALALIALLLYSRGRHSPGGPQRRAILLGAALVVALVAALAKETALLLVVWVGVYEWLLVRRERPPRKAFEHGMAAGTLFLIPAVVYFGLRRLAVGLKSDKLTAAAGGAGDLWGSLLSDLPLWSLWGGLPVPFGLADRQTLEAWSPLGWVLFAAAGIFGLIALLRSAMRGRETEPSWGLYVLGLTIVALSLAPIFWAELYLRRRYFLTPSVGVVLMLASLVPWVEPRFPRATRIALLVMALCGGVMLVYENDVYRRSGNVAAGFLETIQREVGSRSVRTIDLVTLPRAYGGDAISGAYLWQYSDMESALELMGLRKPRLSHALYSQYADEYTATLELRNDKGRLDVSFRSRHAYEWNAAQRQSENHRGQGLTAILQSRDPEALVLSYDLILPPDYWKDQRRMLFLYSDGVFTRVRPEDASVETGRN